MSTLLIDGDGLLYRACSVVERATQWDEQNWVLSGNAEEAFDIFDTLVVNAMTATKATTMVMAFTKGKCFRYDLTDTYKSNRKDSRKPLVYNAVLSRIEAQFLTKSVPGLEADDLLGIWATNGKFPDPIIMSEDKDMLSIPGKLYRQGAISFQSEADADVYWLTQALTGDTADGYPGCPGVGAVSAGRIMAPTHNLTADEKFYRVVETFEAKGLTYDDALLQVRLARILRADDWNTETKEVKLWEPSSPPST